MPALVKAASPSTLKNSYIFCHLESLKSFSINLKKGASQTKKLVRVTAADNSESATTAGHSKNISRIDMTSGEHNLHYFEWYRAFEYYVQSQDRQKRTEDRKGNSRQALLILYSGLTHSSEFLMCCLALAISAISELLESSSVVDWLGSNCPQLVKKLRGEKERKTDKS